MEDESGAPARRPDHTCGQPPEACARYVREIAALDLSDAEQAALLSSLQADVAAQLYTSADRHRQLAEQLGPVTARGAARGKSPAPR